MLLAILLFALTVAAWGYVVYAINKPWGWDERHYVAGAVPRRRTVRECLNNLMFDTPATQGRCGNPRAVNITTCDPTQLQCTTLGCTHGVDPSREETA
jgi:hypothetical protein